MKQDIPKLIFSWNLFKDDTVMSVFYSYCCSSSENENTLGNEMGKHSTEAATKSEGVKFSKKLK